MEKLENKRLRIIRSEILETAAIRREQFRLVNYFRDEPSEIGLRFLAAGSNYSDGLQDNVEQLAAASSEQMAAQQLINELDAKRAAAIAELPSIETGATIAERFVCFFDQRDFKTLDLSRTNHPGGDWNAADNMQLELNALLSKLNDDNMQFVVNIFELAPETCSMYFHATSPGALETGLICMVRNTLKARVYDNFTKDKIFIKKRSEYIYNLKALDSKTSKLISENIDNHISKNSYLVKEDSFNLINATVAERPKAIELIHSNLFAYREAWEDETIEPEMPQVLRQMNFDGRPAYPELAEAWFEHHKPNKN